jgi:p-aminobenzoyl-glutamate transporter AbgT
MGSAGSRASLGRSVARKAKTLISASMQGLPIHPRLLGYVALAAVAGIGVGSGFAMWSERSAGIFLALVDAGMSWCF